MKFLKKKVDSNTNVNRNGEEVTISYDEYETMAKKVIDSENLAQKRIAAATAQVCLKIFTSNNKYRIKIKFPYHLCNISFLNNT